LEGNAFWEGEVEFALRAFDNYGASVELDGDLFRKSDWLETDS